MKKPIFIVGFVILLLVLWFGAMLIAFKWMFLLGRFLHAQDPITIVLILSIGLGILLRKSNQTFHNYAMRKLGEKGLLTERPESERRTTRFCGQATLATSAFFLCC